jgi:hypothetical protein
MADFLPTCAKKRYVLPGDKCTFINFLYSEQDIAMARSSRRGISEVFILLIGIASDITWLNIKFDMRVVVLN